MENRIMQMVFIFFLIDLKRNLLSSLIMERLIEIIRRLAQLIVFAGGLSLSVFTILTS